MSVSQQILTIFLSLTILFLIILLPGVIKITLLLVVMYFNKFTLN